MDRLRTFVWLALVAACSRGQGPVAADASPPPMPPPPAAVADAGADVHDGAADAPDASGGRPRHKASAAPASGGGKAGLDVKGSLPRADAAKVIHAGAGALKACYQREHPAARGRVSFRLTVDRRGRVTLGEIVSSALASTPAEICMVEATRNFKFPPSPDGSESTVTFQMSFP